MDLTQEAHGAALINDICLSARMQVRMVALWIVMNLLVHSHLVEEFLYHALHIKEISASIHTQSKLHPLIGKLG